MLIEVGHIRRTTPTSRGSKRNSECVIRYTTCCYLRHLVCQSKLTACQEIQILPVLCPLLRVSGRRANLEASTPALRL